MDNDLKLVYDNVLLLQEEIKSMKRDINNVIEELNVKVARLETQMDVVLEDKGEYTALNNKVQVLEAQIKELIKANDSNHNIVQMVIVGVMVFIANYVIQFIHF